MKSKPYRVFLNGTVILPDRIIEDGVVVCCGRYIEEIGRKSETRIPREAAIIDAKRGLIGPGYVDIHVHGGEGADFMDGTTASVRQAARAHARHGTTTIFPTTTTGSPKQIKTMLASCREVHKHWSVQDGAQIPGIHLYGPYFAEDKIGAHSKLGRRNPNPIEYRRYFNSGFVRIATCAAELKGAEQFYREARKRGCLITCGHSNSSWEEMAKGFRAGVRHVDHFWCAMSSVTSIRQRFGFPFRGSMEQFVLMHKEMSTEVIADGIHLSPELLEFAFIIKGAERLCLVSDASRALGMPAGKYRIGPKSDGNWFKSDGRVALVPKGSLASSIVPLETMVRNMHNMTTATVAQSVRMASLTPAERAGISATTGSLAKGKFADILVLKKSFQVARVFIQGEELLRQRSKQQETEIEAIMAMQENI